MNVGIPSVFNEHYDDHDDEPDREDPSFSLTAILLKHKTKGSSHGIFEDEERMNLLPKKNPFD